MKPQFPPPSQPTLFAFIIESTRIEREEITPNEVSLTFKREQHHPSAAGHFSAIKYAVELAQRNDFPSKHPSQWETPAKAHTNLYWLRDLHKKLMTPTADYGVMMANPNYIKKADCGNYRLSERQMVSMTPDGNTLVRQMPKATDLGKLLHLWYKQIGEFHQSISAVLHRPSPADLQRIEDMAWKAHLQLQCIHPWTDGTGRSARIVENILRLRWGLAWKTIMERDKVKYIQQIMAYEDGPEWQGILKSVAAPGR